MDNFYRAASTCIDIKFQSWYPEKGYEAVVVITKVILTKQAEKDLTKTPQNIIAKLDQWIETVEDFGLEEARKTKVFQDEPLKGKRIGLRSIRLNISYRAIYIIRGESLLFVEVIEVNKHDY